MMKFAVIRVEKVNVVGLLGKASRYKDSNSKEESIFLDRDVAGI